MELHHTQGGTGRPLVLLPSQAERARAAFPKAEVHWFDGCGHFPQWDQPQETVSLILSRTG